MSNLPHPILIVTGMHRSGTSLTASLLQSAGVDMGKNLMPPSEGNIKGHFEDLDIVQFHENALKANHFPPEGWTILNQVNYIPQDLKIIAKEVISKKRNQANITGWKDPRGTLFLNFWESELPEAKFIFLYRNPWEVVDSLYRRGDAIFQENPEFALAFWKTYNQAIINFYDNYSDKSILINIESIRDNPENLSNVIAQQFNLKISIKSQVYDSSFLKSYDEQSPYSLLIKEFFPNSIAIYQELELRRDSPYKEKFKLKSNNQIQAEFNKNYLLKNWLRLRNTERNLFKVQSQLENLEQKEKELKTSLDQTTEALEHSQNQLTETTEALKHSQNQLTETTEALKHSQNQLAEKDANIRHLEEKIAAMKSSKFWKMRQLWMRMKQLF